METDTSHVYESFHPSRCEKLAIKCLKKEGRNPQAIEDECAIMMQLSNEYCMSLVETIELPDYRCIVMPMAVGGDLFDFLEQNGAMHEDAACQAIHCVLQALIYMHGIGVWHRDIKPENLLLMDDSVTNPHVVVADFGLAKPFLPGETCTEFLSAHFYAAPEIHLRQPYTEAVDIWSLGVTMYMLLSGEAPFPHDAIALRDAVTSCTYDFDSELWDEVSDEAKDLIQQMLVLEPDERITSSEAKDHPWFAIHYPNAEKPRLARVAATAVGAIDTPLDKAGEYIDGDGEDFDTW
jgi:serine/threonine protein kinase